MAIGIFRMWISLRYRWLCVLFFFSLSAVSSQNIQVLSSTLSSIEFFATFPAGKTIDSLEHFIIVPHPSSCWIDDIAVEEYGVEGFGESAYPSPIRLQYYGQVAFWHVVKVTVYRKWRESVVWDNSGFISAKKLRIRIGLSGGYQALSSGGSQRKIPDVSLFLPKDQLLNPEASLWWNVKTGNSGIAPIDGERWWKIQVEREGVYQISLQQLQQMGISPDSGTLATVKLYGIGGKPLPEGTISMLEDFIVEQPLIPLYDEYGNFQKFLFYGSAAAGTEYQGRYQHYRNPYSDKVFYLLTVGGGKRQDFQYQDPPAEVEFTEYVGMQLAYLEEDNFQLLQPGSGRNWVGSSFDQYTPAVHILPIRGLVLPSTLHYRVRLAHYSSKAGEVRVFEHQTPVVVSSLPAVTQEYSVAYFRTVEFALPATDIGEDRSVLRFEYSSADLAGSAYLDWIEIQYTAKLQANGGECVFFTMPEKSGAAKYVISGFQDVPTVAFDVTDDRRPQLLPVNILDSKAEVFVTATTPRKILVSQNFLSPVLIPAENAGLRHITDGYDVIVVTHPLLLQSAHAYAEYRSGRDNFKVLVVTTEQIYNEFAAGNPDPTAIRNFLAFAFHQWSVPPQFVVFWGDGHYDYRNIRTQQTNFVPPWESADTTDGYLNAIYSTCTEDFFVRIAGDDRANDLAIGRITIQSNEQGMKVLQKIQRYEDAAALDLWRLRVTLVADDSPTGIGSGDGTLHTSQSERLSTEYIPSYMIQRKIYLPDYPYENLPGRLRRPQVTADLLNSINTGTAILNWIGHGNPRVWAHEEIFNKDEHIAQMQNESRPFFLTAATCDFARFDDPQRQSGGEDLLIYDRGGAIAVFSSIRAVFAFDNARLNEQFYGELFRQENGAYPRLGVALLRVKNVRHNSNDEKFYLLGDPLLHLVLPTFSVTFDTVNGYRIETDSSQIPVAPLSAISVSGRITANQGLEVPIFDGRIQLFLFDAATVKEAVDYDGTKHRFLKPGSLLNLGAGVVQNGRFSASLIVPKDVNFTGKTVKLLAYALDTVHNVSAKGVNEQCIISGDIGTELADRRGPTIQIFLEDRFFKPCDPVSPQPLLIVDLFDSTGINASGIGVGHDIQAWIDEAPVPIVLTTFYQPSLDDPRRGTVTRFLPFLSPGVHSVKVRAWDIVGNWSEAEVCFHVGEQTKNVAKVLDPYPLPFSEKVTIPIRYFGETPADLVCIITDLQGKVLWQLHIPQITDGVQLLEWQPAAGTANGVYYYRIFITTDSVQQSIGGKIVYNR